jgi:hypothetical protein
MNTQRIPAHPNSSPMEGKDHIGMRFRDGFGKPFADALSLDTAARHGPDTISDLVAAKNFIVPWILPDGFAVNKALHGAGKILLM